MSQGYGIASLQLRRCRELKSTRDDRDVLAAESLIDELLPLSSKLSENCKTVLIGLFEGKVDVFQGQAQREFGRVIVLPNPRDLADLPL